MKAVENGSDRAGLSAWFPGDALRERLLCLSARELSWVLELLSLLEKEDWQDQRTDICRTIAEIVFPGQAARGTNQIW